MLGERGDIIKLSVSKYEEYYNGMGIEEVNGSGTETAFQTMKEMKDDNNGEQDK